MTTSYLVPRNSLVVGSPTPTTSVFGVTTGTGRFFQVGSATVGGFVAQILSVVTDLITLAAPLPFAPVIGAEVVQCIPDQKDMIRLLTGDNDTDDWQLQDEEIAMFLGGSTNPYRAGADACEAIAAKLARKVDYQIYQEIQEKLSDQMQHYLDLARKLRLQAAKSSVVPIAGGLLQRDKELASEDTTFVPPFFTRDMDTEPGTEIGQNDPFVIREPF